MTANQIEVELKHGKAYLRPFVTRKASREWKIALWKDAEDYLDEKSGEMKPRFSEASASDAQDIFVKNMVTKLDYSGKEYDEVTQDVIDLMESDDFMTLKDAAFKMLFKNAEAKKKS